MWSQSSLEVYKDIIEGIHACIQAEIRHHGGKLLMHLGGVWSPKLIRMFFSYIVEQSLYVVSMYID